MYFFWGLIFLLLFLFPLSSLVAEMLELQKPKSERTFAQSTQNSSQLPKKKKTRRERKQK